MEEWLLTCEGAKLCDLCKPENPWKYHGARYIIPFSLEFPHFEVITEYLTLSFHTFCQEMVNHSCYLLTYILKPVKKTKHCTDVIKSKG